VASDTPSRSLRRVAVLGGNRIPFARSDRAYAEASNQDMFTAALGGLVDRFGLGGERLGAVIGGAVLKHSRDFNLMRESVLGSALSSYTPAFDLQQACGTGLQAAIAAADGVASGRYEVAAAGGVDTTSDAPIALGNNLRHTLLGLRRAKSNVERLKLVGKLPASLGVEIPVNSEPPSSWASSGSTRMSWPSPATATWPRPTTGVSSTIWSPRFWASTATTICGRIRRWRNWPSSSRCSA